MNLGQSSLELFIHIYVFIAKNSLVAEHAPYIQVTCFTCKLEEKKIGVTIGSKATNR